MAKGDGGGGHFDERRRAAKAANSRRPDTPEVLAAITKPRAKPTVVIKKKPRIRIESDGGDLPIPGTRIKTTRYNTEKSTHMPMDRPRDIPSFGGPEPGVRLADRLYPSSNRAAKGNRGGNYTPPRDRAAENTQGPSTIFSRLTDIFPKIRRRNAMRMLDT